MLREMHQVNIEYAYMLKPQHLQPNPVSLSADEPIARWFLLSSNYFSPTFTPTQVYPFNVVLPG